MTGTAGNWSSIGTSRASDRADSAESSRSISEISSSTVISALIRSYFPEIAATSTMKAVYVGQGASIAAGVTGTANVGSSRVLSEKSIWACSVTFCI